MACTEREWHLENGIDSSSYISATITGTCKQYDNVRFMSNRGPFDDEYHPEFTMHDDDTFDFELSRALDSKSGERIWLEFEWNNINGKIKLDKVYSLKAGNDSRGRISLYATDKKSNTQELKVYNATGGWIVFKSKRVYSGGMLYSGEFCFDGVTEDGEKASVTDGYIIDCRICIADDYGCVER